MIDPTEIAPVISRRPAWAEKVNIGPRRSTTRRSRRRPGEHRAGWRACPTIPVDHEDAGVRRRTEKRHPLPSAHSPAQPLCTSWSMADDR